MITIDDFLKLEFKVGTILEAEEVEGSEKLLKFKVDFGPLSVNPSEVEGSQDEKSESADFSPLVRNDNDEEPIQREDETSEKRDVRQILSGIKQWYAPEDMKGKQFVFITNLEPRKMMGLESQGMILAVGEEKPIMLIPQTEVSPGAKIR